MNDFTSATYGTRIKDHLRELMIRGILPPGQRVNEVRLAADLGVSRTPVREAIASLVAEGWLEMKPHKGATVRAFPPRTIEELLQLREILEMGALELVAKRQDIREVAERLLAAAICSDTALQNHAYSNSATCDFHYSLLLESNNGTLAELGHTTNTKLRAIRFRSGADENRRRVADREHRLIIHALADSDAAAARQALLDHLNSAAALMRDLNRPPG